MCLASSGAGYSLPTPIPTHRYTPHRQPQPAPPATLSQRPPAPCPSHLSQAAYLGPRAEVRHWPNLLGAEAWFLDFFATELGKQQEGSWVSVVGWEGEAKYGERNLGSETPECTVRLRACKPRLGCY